MHEQISVRIQRAGRAARIVRVNARGAIIGRDPHADIQLDDPDVSRVHARIEHDGVHFRIQDLVSATGTWMDGAEVAEHRLRGDDCLRIGPFELLFTHPIGEPAVGEEVLGEDSDEFRVAR